MRNSWLILFILISSCNSDYNPHKKVGLIIQDADSYKCDFEKEIYTIYYIDKLPLEVKFKLSNNEKKSINEKYYEMKLYDIKEKIINDNCMWSPKIYTTLDFKSENTHQEIRIERGCKDFNFNNKINAQKINDFLNYIDEILKAKAEIKNAPKSNVPYM